MGKKKLFIILILFNLVPVILLFFWFILSFGIFPVHIYILQAILLIFMLYVKLYLCIIDSIILCIYSFYLIKQQYYNKNLITIFF